eukprot:TRINITY_DN7259_c0_g1_i2.p1 TRINITY_DN7259_c0_g1~~TRINITY_DN7259_c0_g1_i2.p1  ORF type:complete len:1236 (+),score=253.18 TRINITY_DN7259_c0_g1_i2:130-3837(+)
MAKGAPDPPPPGPPPPPPDTAQKGDTASRKRKKPKGSSPRDADKLADSGNGTAQDPPPPTQQPPVPPAPAAAAAHPLQPATLPRSREPGAGPPRASVAFVSDPACHPSAFAVTPGQFFLMIQDKDLSALHRMGGLEGVAASLCVDLGPEPYQKPQGLDPSTLQRRIDVYGENFIPDEEELTYLSFLKEALSDKMMILLLVLGSTALVINLSFPEQGEDNVHYDKAWIDGTFIIVAVACVVLVTTINDYLKERKFQALNAETSKLAFRVHRGGQRLECDVKEIVVGDLVEFSGGTAVPCDGLFVRGQGVSVDESACTGENDEKKKDRSRSVSEEVQTDPFMISGTNVIAAEDGLLLCIGVGESSFAGKLEMATRTGKVPTPLQEKLDDLADKVGRLGIVVAGLLFLTLTVASAAKASYYGDSYDFKLILDFAIVAVAIIVVAVPEGLPLSVTIALAFSMGAMQKENNLVRSLAACETMGAATNICSDKTGTLTTNNMTQVESHVGGLDLIVHPKGSQQHHHGSGSLQLRDLHPDLSRQAVDLFTDALSFCSSAIKRPAKQGEKADADGKVWEGNKTERGMLGWVERVAPQGFQGIRDSVKVEDRLLYPFQSTKKSMTSLVRRQGKVVQYTKGASEIVLGHSNKYIDAKGAVKDMDAAMQGKLEAVIKRMAQSALRTIGVAYRVFSDKEATPFPEEDPFSDAKDLIFIGISGIEDPVRPEVPDSVELCFNAGVAVRMCTGDNIETAKAIARQCNILRTIPGVGNGIAMTGPDFRRMFVDDAANDYTHFRATLPRVQVLARCSPLDKQLLVGMLMLAGEVVAVTGDGTNDAPALKLADVGFAMDDGTQVAKKASNIVLLDNNFVSVVTACKWGRNVNDSIRKFLQFQFTVNVVLLIVTFVGAVADVAKRDGKGESPLAPVHLLWANLIMDTMAALALSTEKPHGSNCGPLMERPPTYRNAPLISRRMWRFVLGGAAYQLAVVLTLIFRGKELFSIDTDPDWVNVTGLASQAVTVDNVTVGYSPFSYTPDDRDTSEEDGDMLHRTVIFNVFVYMQVFNWFHARNLYNEVNPFTNFDRSPLFLPIIVFTAVFQAFMVEVAQGFLETKPPGGVRWAVSLAIAALVVPIGCLIRLIPIEEAKAETEPLTGEEDGQDSGTKYDMIMKVQRMNHDLFGEDTVVSPKVRTGAALWRHAQRLVRVCRAFRGKRGPFAGVRSPMTPSSTSSAMSPVGVPRPVAANPH